MGHTSPKLGTAFRFWLSLLASSLPLSFSFFIMMLACCIHTSCFTNPRQEYLCHSLAMVHGTLVTALFFLSLLEFWIYWAPSITPLLWIWRAALDKNHIFTKSIWMWADVVALTRIGTDRGTLHTHLGTYQFIETHLVGMIQVDLGSFVRIWMLWQVLLDKQCGWIWVETYCKIHICVNCCGMRLDALGSCHIKMLFRSSSSLLNRILYFVQWCPSNNRWQIVMFRPSLAWKPRLLPGLQRVRLSKSAGRARAVNDGWLWLSFGPSRGPQG